MSKPLKSLPLVLLLTMTCAGCVTSGTVDIPLARQIPADCENLARREPYPAFGKGENMRLLAAKNLAGLVRANDRLDATRECQAKQRETFAKGGK
jgi:hypothetical protein